MAMPVYVDTYDSWGNYQGTVSMKTDQEKGAENLGGCIGIILGLFLIYFVQGLVAMLPLVLRVFMEPEVAQIHARRSRKLFIAAVIVFGAYIVINQFTSGDSSATMSMSSTSGSDAEALKTFGIVVVGMGIAAQILAWIQQFIASMYPDKVNGNGYGLIALVALIPSVRPTRTMTLISDWGPIVAFLLLYVVGYVLALLSGTTDPENNFVTILIYLVIGMAMIFGVPLWYLNKCDNEFRSQVE
jgi:hypothetical protein